jgi:uncharacterized protein (TIGR00369 family)
MPFALFCGIELSQTTAENVTGSLAWSEDKCTVAGALHGGVIMTLADSLGALCAFMNLPDGATTSTIESKTNFFGGVRAGRVHARRHPLHVGRSTIVVQTDVTDDAGKGAAQVTQTQAVLGG